MEQEASKNMGTVLSLPLELSEDSLPQSAQVESSPPKSQRSSPTRTASEENMLRATIEKLLLGGFSVKEVSRACNVPVPTLDKLLQHIPDNGSLALKTRVAIDSGSRAYRNCYGVMIEAPEWSAARSELYDATQSQMGTARTHLGSDLEQLTHRDPGDIAEAIEETPSQPSFPQLRRALRFLDQLWRLLIF
ncbi:hypothetical protein J8273_7869 [Carpediemonas membranifera]|uniref:Uncharacterized protein n=1 Tax=Carpediemonas membranifera TaxID=201153 RepID=A0A8J6DZC1_9EUKA|nr:hypothetical protein J8273_7869 [Carpediemonas membranifera]|eukprot:KAG9390518.1 hypothetical protein J8273_7869 [Carpediemonas membranifera]